MTWSRKPILIRFRYDYHLHPDPPGRSGRSFLILDGEDRYMAARHNQKHQIDAIDAQTRKRYVIDPVIETVTFCRDGIPWKEVIPPLRPKRFLFCVGRTALSIKERVAGHCLRPVAWFDAARRQFYCDPHKIKKERQRHL